MGKRKLAVAFRTPTALVHPTAQIGSGTKVWAFAQIAEHASIGKDCVIGNGVYIDRYVCIGNRVWIQNKALLYQGVVVQDDVFIGPAVCFTNDPWPKAGKRRNMTGKKWRVGKGASIGASATILPEVSIGARAFVAAGAVVTKNVPPNALVQGNPARIVDFVCPNGHRLNLQQGNVILKKEKVLRCKFCRKQISIG